MYRRFDSKCRLDSIEATGNLYIRWPEVCTTRQSQSYLFMTVLLEAIILRRLARRSKRRILSITRD